MGNYVQNYVKSSYTETNKRNKKKNNYIYANI